MKQPEITCLIPVFNTNPAALMEAVQCIVDQSYPAKRILILDDGSTDYRTTHTLEIINRWTNVSVIWLENNGGTSAALNHGHKMVNTEWVAIMGSDDVCHADRFKKQAEFLMKHPNVDVLGTQLFSFYNADITRRSLWKSNHPQFPRSIEGSFGTRGFIVNHGTVIYRNSAVIGAGGYDLAKRRGQDVDLWKRMWAKGSKFANINEVLYGWRRFK